MASLLLKRSCNPSALRSMVSSSLGIATPSRSSATVAVGSDVLSAAAPDASPQKSWIWGDDGVSSKFSTTPVNDIFKGAHTRVGSLQHVPSYKNNIDKFKAKEIDSIVYGAIKNPYVINAQAWKLRTKDAVGFHSGAPKSDLQKDASHPSDILRPLSPHLPVYKPHINATFSIYHRITGAFLSTFILTFYLLFMKMGLICFTFEKFYQFFYFLYSPKLILISCEIAALALAYHIVHGVRHLRTDFSGSTIRRMGRNIVK